MSEFRYGSTAGLSARDCLAQDPPFVLDAGKLTFAYT